MVYTLPDGTNVTRRKKIVLTGGSDGSLTDYQLKLSAAYAAAMQSAFGDIRFAKGDFSALIDAWLEDKTDDTSADIWAEFPTTPANGVKQDYWMYYGNAAASDWDIGATFLFGDDFDRDDEVEASITGWTPGSDDNGVWSVTSNELKWTSPGTSNMGTIYKDLPADAGHNFVVEYKFKRHLSYYGAFRWAYQATNDYAELRLNDNAYIYYTEDGADITSQPGHHMTAKDLWYSAKIEVYPSGSDDIIKVYEWWNGSVAGTPSSISGGAWTERFSYTDTTPQTTGKIGFRTHAASTSEIHNYDNIFGRKYAANPPTAAIGTEEHQRRTPQFM